jgi:deoxyribodipyrimidine photolyase-related protein
MFLCGREDFAEFLKGRARPQMASFYKFQRTRLGILVDAEGAPTGGRWSFDEDNRKKLPKNIDPPALPEVQPDALVGEVSAMVSNTFAEHPGSVDGFRWPVTRQGALEWLDDFLHQRLALFGPYEDAISQRSKTVFHSALSPLLNLGLMTPKEVVHRTLQFAENNDIPMQSLEGFIRQVIGWRNLFAVCINTSVRCSSRAIFGNTTAR